MPSPEYPLPCRVRFYLMFVCVNDIYVDVLMSFINTSMTNPINYLTNSFRRPFPKISWQYASTYEIEKNY